MCEVPMHRHGGFHARLAARVAANVPSVGSHVNVFSESTRIARKRTSGATFKI